MPETIVGKVSIVNLEINIGADFGFDIRWWLDKEKTIPIDIESLRFAIKELQTDTEAIIEGSDTGDYVTISDNEAQIRIPADITDALVPLDRGVWDLEATATVGSGGETKRLMRGTVRIVGEVSA